MLSTLSIILKIFEGCYWRRCKGGRRRWHFLTTWLFTWLIILIILNYLIFFELVIKLRVILTGKCTKLFFLFNIIFSRTFTFSLSLILFNLFYRFYWTQRLDRFRNYYFWRFFKINLDKCAIYILVVFLDYIKFRQFNLYLMQSMIVL